MKIKIDFMTNKYYLVVNHYVINFKKLLNRTQNEKITSGNAAMHYTRLQRLRAVIYTYHRCAGQSYQ